MAQVPPGLHADRRFDPPGVRPARHRFLTRNRLVAAVSGAAVVVEAGLRSGAANTAAWARALGRVVAAVPGPVTSSAEGTRLPGSGQPC